MIDKATVDKILDAVEIVDVINDFVSLKRRGANYIACCPFHNEKTPSFSVSPSKGIFKCFGCGKAGSAVTFIMEHEQMTYVEALKYLGKKYGIEVHEKEETQEDVAQRLRHESLLAVSEFARKFYSDYMMNTDLGRAVGLSYFKQEREMKEETIETFGLGYAPNAKSAFADAALKSGYKREFLLATGLCIERGSGELVDKFYDRVMFPIHSLSGRVIAFGGRTLMTDKSVAKYVNSPETEIYHKSRSLYGFFFAKSSIARLQKCYLVEGYTDVISLHQAGVENVVASSGTSLTIDQIRLIKRFTPKVTVLYDGDSAGIKASIRGIDMLLEEGLEVKVALFPEGHDPDSFARSHTRDEIVDFLNNAETDFINFKYELLSEDIAKDPIRKAELIREIVRTISLIPDRIVRSVYIEESSRKLDVKQEIMAQEVAKMRKEHIISGEYERRRSQEREERLKEADLSSLEAIAPEENDAGTTSPISQTDNEITNQILQPIEKELLYYLLKFGENIIHFEEHQSYGSAQPVMSITVSQYISSELANDDLEFQNPLYKNIFQKYYLYRDEELKEGGEHNKEIQNKIERRFIASPDETLTKAILDIIYEEYTINVKKYREAMIPEENVLHINVPKAVLIFKSKITEYTYNIVTEQLAKAQAEGDTETQKQLIQQIRILIQVKNAFSKELNRLN